MRKPTGVSGVIRVQVNPDGTVSGGFEEIPFSSEKEAVELATALAFIRSMNREMNKSGENFFMSDPRSNPENHFDLTVSTPEGDAYLELREIQPGIPYDQAPGRYYTYQFAHMLRTAIQTKSDHYAHPDPKLFLLLYSTHWAFNVSDTALMCLRYWLAQDKPVFDAVFTYQPFNEREGVGEWIYPFPPDQLGDFDPDSVKDHWYVNLDPTTSVIESG